LLPGAFFENVFSPKGWQKNLPNKQNPLMFGFVQLQMGSTISICKFDANNTTDAFKHIPDLFWMLCCIEIEGKWGLAVRDWEIGFGV